MAGAVAVVSASACLRPRRSRHLMCQGSSFFELWIESCAGVDKRGMTVEKEMENEKTQSVFEALSYQRLFRSGQMG